MKWLNKERCLYIISKGLPKQAFHLSLWVKGYSDTISLDLLFFFFFKKSHGFYGLIKHVTEIPMQLFSTQMTVCSKGAKGLLLILI